MSAPLPDLREGRLDAGALDSLVADLLECAEILEVTTRPAGLASELPAARDALRSGRARAVQVRYRHAGAEWRDTLLADPAGIRLVRMETPSLGGPPCP